MIKYLLYISFAALISLTTSIFAQTPFQKHGNLKTKGAYIINKNNKIPQLRGMSFYWSRTDWPGASYYNAATVDALVNTWKCTVVRVAYGNQANWDGCKTVINAAVQKGIYVIIDWHSHNAETEGDAPISFFKERAQEYKNVGNVIFEVYNEPKWSGSAVANDGGVPNAKITWAAIKPYLKKVTKAIRDQGAQNLVILGTPYFAQHVGVAADDPVLDDNGQPFSNVAYSFHFYAASHGSAKGGMEESYLKGGLDRVPVFVTEWGTTNSDGGGGADEANTKLWFDNYIDRYHLGWCNWSVSSHEGSSAFSGSGGTNPSASGQIVQKYLSKTTVDEYALPDIPEEVGYETQFKDVVQTPAVHPAAKYNRYYGATVKSENIPFAQWDEKEPKNANNTCVSVIPGSSNWISYSINAAKATKYLKIRYLANNGSGKFAILLDSVKQTEVTLSATSAWKTLVIDLNVPTGAHTLRFNFTTVSDAGFRIEWLEFTDESTAISQNNQDIKNTAISFFQTNDACHFSLPGSHQFTSYSIVNANGRTIRHENINPSSTFLNVTDIPNGIFLIRLNGFNDNRIFKAVSLKP
ncbi:MAG TPA: cellulase family glycosylhydrolase [Chitinispirillaceae bacterium]|nr:cellulase family glycosylhydrolase [Chitinispirillaceae bacterium]